MLLVDSKNLEKQAAYGLLFLACGKSPNVF
jgi:hypothetical protein